MQLFQGLDCDLPYPLLFRVFENLKEAGTRLIGVQAPQQAAGLASVVAPEPESQLNQTIDRVGRARTGYR